MGDMFSSKKTSSEQTSINEQVAQQGSGQVGRVQGNYGDVAINVTDGTDVAIYAARDTAIAALDANRSVMEGVAQASNVVALTSLEQSKVAGAMADRGFDTADKALDVATAVNNASHQSVIMTLGALQAVQDRAADSVDAAVAAAQHTALNATPVSPGAYLEASEARIADQQKYLYAAIAAVLIVAVVAAYKKS